MINLAGNERPMRYSEAIGQEINVKILKAMSQKDSFAKAYLFEGVRGCGKTTLARVTAMAANCRHKTPDGEPCCECESCKKIMRGEMVDVVEIDAASNNSVERARELIEESRYKPMEAKTKVYIIDEAHMLSNGAFNALLKLLEEPPEWCMYILCTTAKSKIPATILSRCTAFSFKAIAFEKIAEHLKEIVNKYQCTITDDAAYAIAAHSGGSMRDALRDLEKCFSETIDIGVAEVTDALGFEPYEQVFKLITTVAGNRAPEIITCCERYRSEGKDMVNILTDAVGILTDLVIEKAGGTLLERGEGYMGLLKDLADKVSLEQALYLSKKFAEVRKSAMYDPDMSAITVELLRIASVNEEGIEALEVKMRLLEERVEALEAKLAAGNAVNTASYVTEPVRMETERVQEQPKAQPEPEAGVNATSETDLAFAKGFSVITSGDDNPFADDEAYWQQVAAVAEEVARREEEEAAEQESTHAVAVQPEKAVPAEAAGEPEKAPDSVSSVSDFLGEDIGGLFDMFDSFTSPEANVPTALAQTFRERLERVKAEDPAAKDVLDSAEEVNVYNDGIEVIPIGYMENVTRQALAKYEFIKVLSA